MKKWKIGLGLGALAVLGTYYNLDQNRIKADIERDKAVQELNQLKLKEKDIISVSNLERTLSAFPKDNISLIEKLNMPIELRNNFPLSIKVSSRRKNPVDNSDYLVFLEIEGENGFYNRIQLNIDDLGMEENKPDFIIEYKACVNGNLYNTLGQFGARRSKNLPFDDLNRIGVHNTYINGGRLLEENSLLCNNS